MARVDVKRDFIDYLREENKRRFDDYLLKIAHFQNGEICLKQDATKK